MFQVFLRLCSGWSLLDGPVDVSALATSDSFSRSFLSFSLDEKSKPELVPGVLGVLACPKDANAPVPKPKAEDPPGAIPGDFADAGEAVLNGFDFPWEDLAPNARGESTLPLSLVSRSLVGSVILSLVLCSSQQDKLRV